MHPLQLCTVDVTRGFNAAQVRGKDIPKPVKNWNQCGISSRVLDVLKKGGLSAPMPIQARPSPRSSAAIRDRRDACFMEACTAVVSLL